MIGARSPDDREPAFHIEKIGFDNPGALVWMRQAAGVSLHHNMVSAPGSYLHTLLDTDGTVTGISELQKPTLAPELPEKDKR